MDRSSWLGLVIALGGILAGLIIDGGNVGQVLQPTAALIVFGGTLGSVMIQFPLEIVLRSFKEFKTIFMCTEPKFEAMIDQLVDFAKKARKEGIVALDKDLEGIHDSFLKKTLMLAVDGTQPNELRQNMEVEMGNQTEQAERVIQVYDAAGGFAPTIGIIGAILGLIQVMQHLNNIDEVGRGIAVAFVATVYGVAIANIGLLPMAGKLRLRRRQADLMREMMLEGVIGILEGTNPRVLQTKLGGYLAEPGKQKAEGKEAASSAPEMARAGAGRA